MNVSTDDYGRRPVAPVELTRHMRMYGPIGVGIVVLDVIVLATTYTLSNWRYPNVAGIGTLAMILAITGVVSALFVHPTSRALSAKYRDIWFAEQVYTDLDGRIIDELDLDYRVPELVDVWRDVRPTIIWVFGAISGICLLVILAGIGYFNNPV